MCTPTTFVWGGGSKLRIILPYLTSLGRQPDFVFDEYIDKISFDFNGKHLADPEEIKLYAPTCDAFVVAIGGLNGERRTEISDFLSHQFELKAINLIHDRAYVCKTASFGNGLMMMPGSVIHSYTEVGEQCIINTNASIDHECKVGKGVHIMGGAVVTGRVTIEDYASIGSNATILPDLIIGKGAIVGAGAVVTRNVGSYSTVIGIPARALKNC